MKRLLLCLVLLAVAGCRHGQQQSAGDSGPAQILRAHWFGVQCIAFSPDGKFLATGSEDYTVKLWDTRTWRVERSLKHTDTVNDVVFSPDGRTLVVAARDRVKVWSVITEQLLRVLPQSGGRAVFSPGGSVLAVLGAADPRISLWDTTTWRRLRVLPGGREWSVAFSPDGKTLAAGGLDIVELWDTTTWHVKHKLRGKWGPSHRFPHGWVKSMAFSPDGRILATAAEDVAVRLWDTSSWRELGVLGIPMVRGGITSVAFSPDGKRIAGGCFQGNVRLWDASTRQVIRTLEGQRDWVLCVAFSPDGKLLATGSFDATTMIWPVPDVSRRQSGVLPRRPDRAPCLPDRSRRMVSKTTETRA